MYVYVMCECVNIRTTREQLVSFPTLFKHKTSVKYASSPPPPLPAPLQVWVLICTDLMGRGIDFRGVNLVINYDFPTSAISYIHRVGRTGRAGREGRAVTFFTEDDTVNLRR